MNRVARFPGGVIKASWARSFASLRMTRWRARGLRRALSAIGILLAVLTIGWLVLPKPPLLEGISFSQCIRDRQGNVLRLTLTSDQKFRIRTSLGEISPELVEATLQYEDKYYVHHPGVNPVALLRSAWMTWRPAGIRAGGSTITMQLARLRFHLQTRTISGKVNQILKALELERHYSKQEILEAYLNLAPYGRNIEGIGAASQIYFDKSAARLTGPEAVALCVIPQSPTRRALFSDSENRSVNNAQGRWYDRTKMEIGGQLLKRDFSARADNERKFLAPHFVQQILEGERINRQIVTTLDLEKQQLVERRIRDYVETSRNRGIVNAASLLVDCRTMEILAQVGSAGFWNQKINGQIDGTRGLRSPGSTLKPFVYALAIDQGLIHPLSILADAPRSFGEYNPENFDRDFLGPIRACDALARSRNIPAVTLASELKHPTLYEFLRGADVRLPQPSSFYGLTLPLGGAEISMQDLVRLYAALANGGELRPLGRTLADPVLPKGRRILSPESAFLTLEMLGNVPRPELNCAASPHDDPVFWKTGTSHGFRDAWAIAVFDHYVLAVWVGNFDGQANPEFVGRTAAGPLLFQIIDAIRANWPGTHQPHLPPPGANLKRVEFCAVSGELPGPFCGQRVEGWFIPGISPIRTCDVHREVLVDAATGLRVPVDDGTRELRREVYEFWPTELLALFEGAGLPRKVPPPFLPGTSPEILARNGEPPKILGPATGAAILLAESSTVPLRAKAEADVRELYWFANKGFIGKSSATDVLSWKSRPGLYELTALDDHGRSASCTVRVR